MALVFMFIQVMAVFLNVALQKRYKEHEDYQLQVRGGMGIVDRGDGDRESWIERSELSAEGCERGELEVRLLATG